MTGPPVVAVVDLDGVLVDLRLDTARVRRELNAILASQGTSIDGEDLIAGIESACARVDARDAGGGASLATRLRTVVDEEEARCASACSIHPGAHAFLDRLSGVPVALCTNRHHACALAALRAVGIDPARFFSVQTRQGAVAIEPTAALLPAILSTPEVAAAERVFLVGHHPADIGAALAAREGLEHRTVCLPSRNRGFASRPFVAPRSNTSSILSRRASGRSQLRNFARSGKPFGALDAPAPPVIAIGYAHSMAEVPHLEAVGADFAVTDIGEAAELILAPRSPHTLSMVLLAWNEEASIAAAVRDCRRVGRLWLSGYEIVVVDDGSVDETAARAEAASLGDVRVVRHARNLGMGAALRSGYAAARCEYIAFLPADRQVRPQSLLVFLPWATPETTVVSTYLTPPAGEGRRLMSLAFRFLVRGLGGLSVDFAGSYVFHRRWLETIDLTTVRSETFVFSFELLERMRQAGSRFASVTIRPFVREVGQSREVALRRIVRVFGEIVRYRVRTLTST